MSATFLGRGSLFNHDPAGAGLGGRGTIADGSAGVIENLETVLMSARQMELALIQERKRVRALQEELNNAQATYERLLKDARTKGDEISNREIQLKSALSKYQEHERVLREKLTTLSAGYRKAMAELQHYKNTWAGVLQREREARMIIQDSQRTINRSSELEQENKALAEAVENEKKVREQFERHAKSYQQELQNALVRLHSSESKFAELSKEFAALQQTRKTLDEEVTRIEKTMRERFEWESIRERERMKAELEKENAVLLDRQRMELEQKFQAELRVKLESEKTRRDLVEASLETELKRVQERLDEATEECGRLESEVTELSALREEVARLRADTAERTQNLAKSLEEARVETDESNASLQMWRDRANALEQQVKAAEAAAEVAAQAADQVSSDSARKIAEAEQAAADARARAETPAENPLEQELLALRGQLEMQKAIDRMASAGQESAQERILQLEARLAIVQGEAERKQLEIERRLHEEIAAERTRCSQRISRMRKGLKGAKTKQSDEALQAALDAEYERSQGLESALIAEKIRFDRMAALLEAEVERLRSVYPLQDLLVVKDEEIHRIEAQLGKLAPGSVLRQKTEGALAVQKEQRDRLSRILEKAETRIREQMMRIAEAKRINTVESTVDDESANMAPC